jgi:hypothetical protein
MGMKLLKSGRVPKLELNRLWKGIQQAESETLEAIKPIVNEILVKNVGTQYYSLAALKRMGHPYKNRAPGGLAPGIINVQSGEFFRSFKLTGPVASGQRMTLYIENNSWKAEMLLHPGNMIPRPWDSYLMWHLQRAITPKLGAIFASKFKFRWKE